MSERDDRRTPDDSADLAEAARVYGPFEADLIKNFLESYGIASIVRGQSPPFVYPLTVDGMAEFKILVQRTDLERARELISAMPAPDDMEGPEKPV